LIDSIDLLLLDKQHPDAAKLLAFHHANPEFLPRIVAELRLLRHQGRRAGGVKSLIHFLRWEHRWNAVDDFEINDHLGPLAIRACALLWPDINGMVQFRHCGADDILGTSIKHRGTRYGNFLYPGKRAVAGEFLPRTRHGGGLVRPILFDGSVVLPPAVPVLDRVPTFHSLISEAEAAAVIAPLRRLADNSPAPRHPSLLAWLDHVEAQPEIYCFMQKTLLERQPEIFSANSLLEYARFSIRRAAASDKRFTLPAQLGGLYCRALIALNPQFNGRCEFREDSMGMERAGMTNHLIGCSIAPELVNGEPFRRLNWAA
jgi:hypothetical protein